MRTAAEWATDIPVRRERSCVITCVTGRTDVPLQRPLARASVTREESTLLVAHIPHFGMWE